MKKMTVRPQSVSPPACNAMRSIADRQSSRSRRAGAVASRVLVVKLSSLGDLFHALPAVHCLKAGLQATVDWVVHPAYQELVACFTDVDRVIPLARDVWSGVLIGDVRALRAEPYDLIVDLQGILKSALASRLARGSQRIGPSFHREGSRLFYQTIAGPRNKDRHAVEENLDVVRHLGLPVLPPVFPLEFPMQLVGEPEPRVALIPFSRWPSKNWPMPSFVQTGRDLQEHANASIFLIGGAAEAAACAEMEKEFKGRVMNLAGKLSLPQLGGVLQAMNLVIANDSGPMHMAASLGTPVLAVFGPTDKKRTGPYGDRNRVVAGNLRCQPCFAERCKFKDGSCVRAITSECVMTIALEMLNVASASRRIRG
ncbi:MAG: glycosyltransferase family 9 protein [Verrucomicrobia bacterium]|nr:glycosyltransferase family 9 protein [Verrucomicrobiota bacterium]MBU1735774.1 glycosyltransferase family 9 protein [Verrucomicrobiota bacterium]MBU1855570.1 glycosyltransferase family 9 protein [Verrucomicrobiota bacterium]